MKIYVASSWRNRLQQNTVQLLRKLGHEVYDFRNPVPNTGFHWEQLNHETHWSQWTPDQSREALKHPIAEAGFYSDFNAMEWADCCVMVLPCGRSAHTEAGWMKGKGKTVFVFQPTPQEPELMYKIYDGILITFEELTEQFTININKA